MSTKKEHPGVAKFGKKFRYLAGGEDKEFHSIRRYRPDCNVDKIAKPICYTTGRKAKDAGNDPCAKCAKHWKSKH